MVDDILSGLRADHARGFRQYRRRLAQRHPQPKAKPMSLRVEHLTVEIPARSGVLRPVSDVSFEIQPGEVLGLVGESGAGKSMTGSALIGLLEPPASISSGGIWLDDERIDTLDAERLRQVRGRRIGSVFQDPQTSLHPLFQIGKQLEDTILAHLPVDRREARRRALA